MTSFSQQGRTPAMAAISSAVSAAQLARRKPVRVTLTMSWSMNQRLLERSSYEGRSLSNLCAHLLEVGA
jgi:hypothetical protein